ncbi:hypothetical protein ACT8ZV_19400 [Nocardioides sp. MAHUQ-72]|uniref:hypothetical protein n=1 Tax=unclassified Nocardioides TaxID=2615069 RepID=UPI00361459D6
MTADDLTTLLREHVARDEPGHLPDPGPAVRAGRRRLRGQRLAAGAVAAVVVTAAGVAVAQALPDPGGDGPTTAIDPATRRALADYDAQQMPRLLEEHASTVFSRSVPDLPAGDFGAFDGQGNELPPKWYDKASGMSISYGGTGDHRLSVDLSHARSEAEGSSRESCANDVRSHTYLRCEVTTTPDGDLVIERLAALRELAPGDGWMLVRSDRLDRGDPGRLWFERSVKVIHSETFLTYVRETVHAPDLGSAQEELRVPVDDLAELGTDPVLVIPEPPDNPGECGPWTLPSSGVSYPCD